MCENFAFAVTSYFYLVTFHVKTLVVLITPQNPQNLSH